MGDPNLPDTKARAKRIDHRYFRHTQPWRRARRWLVAGVCAAILIWLGFSNIGRGPSGQFVFKPSSHNPGHLTAAHAMFENDCAKCHDGDGRGGFLKTVSDTACLKCHDAGVHSVKQKEFIATVMLASDTQPSDADALAAGANLPLDNHPTPPDHKSGGMRSADCVHCHIEHDGQAALMGSDARVCLECHSDLKSHDALLPPAVQSQIVAFDGNGAHPHFGAHPDSSAGNLAINKDGKLIDSTHIKFNHAFHNTQPGLKDNCVACHTPMSPPPDAIATIVKGRPLPVLLPSDRSLSSEAQAPMGDMQPITFERNCAQCHQLNLTDGLAVPHKSLTIVRSTLADLPALAVTQLDSSDASLKGAAGVQTKVASLLSDATDQIMSDSSYSDRADKATSNVDTASTPNNAYYFKQQAAVLHYFDLLSQGTLDGVAPIPAASPQALGAQSFAKVPEPNAAEAYVAFLAPFGTSCSTCHEMNGGDVPAGYVYKKTLTDAATTRPELSDRLALGLPGPTTDPAGGATTRAADQPLVLLDTLNTGVPKFPRRWFTNSHFDHAAHRDLSCFNCHANAWTSTTTTDVLLPDLDDNHAQKGAMGPDGKAIQTCVDCHGPPAASGAGVELSASSNCITCHVYHDRTKEDSPDAFAREKHRPATMPAL